MYRRSEYYTLTQPVFQPGIACDICLVLAQGELLVVEVVGLAPNPPCLTAV